MFDNEEKLVWVLAYCATLSRSSVRGHATETAADAVKDFRAAFQKDAKEETIPTIVAD